VVKSIQGHVTVQKAKGRIEVRAVNEGMNLADISGDLSAETTNGSIILDRIDSSNVDLYTVNGNISYDGPIKDKGVYRLTTHNGTIAIAVAERVNAALLVRTYNGNFRSTFPVKLDDQNPRKRFTLTLGNGSAHVELESFGGTIALRRPGEPRPEVERERKRRPERERDHADVNVDVDAAIAAAQASIPDAIAAAEASIPEAIAEAQASIPAAIAEAMAELRMATPFVFPAPHPHATPRPTPRRPR
jgi:putative adhesin